MRFEDIVMVRKKWFRSLKKHGVCVSAVITLCFVLPAVPVQAGFEWTPPPVVKKKAPIPEVAAAPVIEVEEIDNPVLPVNPFMESPDTVSVPSNVPVHNASVNMAPLPPPVQSTLYSDVAGFGSDIPLVLAMQQIVPPDYSYSFDDGVNKGVSVSWNGGKPWNQVLEEAVALHDLTVVIGGKTVWVRHSWAMAESDKTRISDVFVSPPVPAEPIMAVRQEQETVLSAPVPMGVAVMEQTEEMSTQSYPRRNPIPFMMKHGNKVGDEPPMPQDAPLPTQLMPEPAAPMPVPLAGVAEMDMPAASPSLETQPVLMQADKGQVMDPFEIRFWHAEPGDSLKEVLGDWTSSANVAMLWDSMHDYKVPAPVRMHGTFPDAVTHVLMHYNQADLRPLGRLHPNLPNGPSVLIVENYSSATQ